MQAAVLSFINTLVMSEKMLGQRIAIRNALEEMNFSKVLWAVRKLWKLHIVHPGCTAAIFTSCYASLNNLSILKPFNIIN